MDRIKSRVVWLVGVTLPWVLIWALMGFRFALLIGKNPHPFLPGVSYTGVMLKAVASWVLWSLAAHVAIGFLCAVLLILATLLIPGTKPPVLGFRPGLLTGLAGVLLFHGFLFMEVPVALGTIQGLRWVPMGPMIALLILAGGWICFRYLGGPERRPAWLRMTLGVVLLFAFIHLPHDLFRRFMDRGAQIPRERSRLLIFSVDGLRQDVAETAKPAWKAPGGSQPIVALPATRLTWHMLLGAEPASYMNALVIPYRSEWTEPPKTRLLSLAKERGLSTGFIIDDPTTLSFGLSRDAFAEVVEPSGGWKHFFTVGMGTCWPVYSWTENFLAPVESTNPWSDPDAYLRDVERGLRYHQWLSTHTCQLHAPFFLKWNEIQKLRPWSWLWHPSRSYIPYQSQGEVERDRYRRADGRANPVNHYRIRVNDLLHRLDGHLAAWVRDYPGMSGVLTSDHGEEHPPIIGKQGQLVNFFTGMHGFALNPATLRVPLHGFGRTQPELGPEDVFSWIDLRDCIENWIHAPEKPLVLRAKDQTGWVIQFNTVQAVHIGRGSGGNTEGAKAAGVKPQELMQRTFLTPLGMWFMDDPIPGATPVVPRKSYALIDAKGMTTLNPIENGTYDVIRYDKDYFGIERRFLKDQEAFDLVRKSTGKRLVPDYFPEPSDARTAAANP